MKPQNNIQKKGCPQWGTLNDIVWKSVFCELLLHESDTSSAVHQLAWSNTLLVNENLL